MNLERLVCEKQIGFQLNGYFCTNPEVVWKGTIIHLPYILHTMTICTICSFLINWIDSWNKDVRLSRDVGIKWKFWRFSWETILLAFSFSQQRIFFSIFCHKNKFRLCPERHQVPHHPMAKGIVWQIADKSCLFNALKVVNFTNLPTLTVKVIKIPKVIMTKHVKYFISAIVVYWKTNYKIIELGTLKKC